MHQEETYSTEPSAPSYAAVADPEVSTDVHPEHPQPPKKHGRRHHKKRGHSPVPPTPPPPKAPAPSSPVQKRAPGTPSYAHVADPEVSTHLDEDAELLGALAAGSNELQRILAGEDGLHTGFVYDTEVYKTGLNDAEDAHGQAEEHEVSDSAAQPTKEPGEMTYQLLPLDPTPGGFDPSKSPSELNEVKASKGDAPAPPRERTVLEKHCDFFDPDGDGVIWPWDTFFGFWVLGYALPICIFAAFAIHIPFSWPTQPHFPIPDLFWRIYIDRLIKHGSDTGAYDHEGGFDQVAFDKIFKRNAKTRPDALTGRELFDLVRRNRVMYDPFGCSAAAFEWLAVYLLLWPADNLFRKDDIKKLYDGRLFYEVAYMQKQKGRFTPPGWHATVMGTKKR